MARDTAREYARKAFHIIEKIEHDTIVCPKCKRYGLLQEMVKENKFTKNTQVFFYVYHSFAPDRGVFDFCYFISKKDKELLSQGESK